MAHWTLSRILVVVVCSLAVQTASGEVSECAADLASVRLEISGAEAGLSRSSQVAADWSQRFDKALRKADLAGAHAALQGHRLAYEAWAREGVRLVNACSCYLLRTQSDEIGCRKKQTDVAVAIIELRALLDIEADVAWEMLLE